MEMLLYLYGAALLAMIIAYRVGASTLRSELQLKAREFEGVVFPPSLQPSFSMYSAIPLKVLFKPKTLSPPLPVAVLARLGVLRRTVLAAIAAALLSFVVLALLWHAGP